MMRALILLLPLVSLILFPWWVSTAVAILAAFAVPAAPLLAGFFADMLYSAPYVAPSSFVYTLLGAGMSAMAFCVHAYVRKNIRSGNTF